MGQNVGQGLAVVHVAFMTGDTDDNVGFSGGGDGDFVAVFIRFMIFTLGDTVDVGFME